jgi:hypothetical protein
MLKAQRLSHISTALTVSAFVAFSWFGHLADNAMDKTGRGDYSEFEQYSRFAGISFWALVLFWVLAVAAAQASPQPYRRRALFEVGLLIPVCFVAAYIGLIAS